MSSQNGGCGRSVSARAPFGVESAHTLGEPRTFNRDTHGLGRTRGWHPSVRPASATSDGGVKWSGGAGGVRLRLPAVNRRCLLTAASADRADRRNGQRLPRHPEPLVALVDPIPLPLRLPAIRQSACRCGAHATRIAVCSPRYVKNTHDCSYEGLCRDGLQQQSSNRNMSKQRQVAWFEPSHGQYGNVAQLREAVHRTDDVQSVSGATEADVHDDGVGLEIVRAFQRFRLARGVGDPVAVAARAPHRPVTRCHLCRR